TYAINHFAVSDKEERIVFNTNLNGKMNLWAMDLQDTFPYLFAHRDESSNFIKFDPENRYVLAGFDKDGDENYQIYAIPPNGGLPQPFITGEPEEKYFFSHLSKDGKRIYYMTSEGNASFLNTRVRHLDDGTDMLINEGELSPTLLAAVSEDEKSFVFSRSFANTYVTSHVKVGEEKHSLTPDPEQVHVTFDPVFTDNNTIYFITDYDSDDVYVAKFDLEKKSFSKI